MEVNISDNHLIKIVNNAVERMDLSPLLNKYKECGTSDYYPMRMLKVRQNELRAEARENCYPMKELDLEKGGALSRKVSLDR